MARPPEPPGFPRPGGSPAPAANGDLVPEQEAAALLGVDAGTLAVWEQRYGRPRLVQAAGGRRAYARGQLEALADALSRTHSIPAAIAQLQAAAPRGDVFESRRLASPAGNVVDSGDVVS